MVRLTDEVLEECERLRSSHTMRQIARMKDVKESTLRVRLSQWRKRCGESSSKSPKVSKKIPQFTEKEIEHLRYLMKIFPQRKVTGGSNREKVLNFLQDGHFYTYKMVSSATGLTREQVRHAVDGLGLMKLRGNGKTWVGIIQKYE